LLRWALLLLAAPIAPFPTAASDPGAPAAAATAPAAPAPAATGEGQPAASPDADPATGVAGATEQAAALPRFLTLPLDRLTPMQQQIRLRIEQERAELTRLAAEYGNASSDEAALAVQKQIHAVKTGTERAVLGIQLAYARAEGRQESVAQLEEALAVLEQGSLGRQAADRPPPRDAQR
jgi:hypothetical protein